MGKTNIDSYFLITALKEDSEQVTYMIKDLSDGVSFDIVEIKESSKQNMVSDWLKGILMDNGITNTLIRYNIAKKYLPLKFNGYLRTGKLTVDNVKVIPDGKARALSKIAMRLTNLDKG